MKHLLLALVVVGAVVVLANAATAQCVQTTYYQPYATYYQPYTTYYAPPAVSYGYGYAPAYTTYYNYRPFWGGYRYYRRPVVYYYGW